MVEIRYSIHPMRRKNDSMTGGFESDPRGLELNTRQHEVLSRYQLLTEELARLCSQIKGVEIIVTEE